MTLHKLNPIINHEYMPSEGKKMKSDETNDKSTNPSSVEHQSQSGSGGSEFMKK
jgi:hypothetical protein